MDMKEIALLGILPLVLHAAILPPPWADPEKNPCASRPGGWLLVYWPPDGKCYRIFHRGHPCPETMELNPVRDDAGGITGECRCPPRTARNLTSDVCYSINSKGPCEKGEYFAAAPDPPGDRRRIGRCTKIKQCEPEEVYWPASNRCFAKFTKGPCPEGQLLVTNKETRLGECKCSSHGALSKYYWSLTKTCHQYYTKGPCQEKGMLFLPGQTCGCDPSLPNYHPPTKRCYEIGTAGPCKTGHLFDVEPPKSKAGCICKPEHVVWEDGNCYRVYTRGPCPPGEIMFANRTCGPNPCPKGKLFFPEDGSCHRVGIEGPCPKGQLVLFEQSARPSVEGISYRGICGCSDPEKCKIENEKKTSELIGRSSTNATERARSNALPTQEESVSKVKICKKNEKPGTHDCHALYSRGPCSQGEWLVPVRQARTDNGVHRFGKQDPDLDTPLLYVESSKSDARCECRQGFTKSSTGIGCHLPLVTLAKFLNGEDLFS